MYLLGFYSNKTEKTTDFLSDVHKYKKEGENILPEHSICNFSQQWQLMFWALQEVVNSGYNMTLFVCLFVFSLIKKNWLTNMECFWQ